jgi:hypothetical protein
MFVVVGFKRHSGILQSEFTGHVLKKKKDHHSTVVVLPTHECAWIADDLSVNGMTTIQWRSRHAGFSKKRHGYSPTKDKCILPSQGCQVT